MASCSPMTHCLMPVTGFQLVGRATNVLPLQKNSWPTYARIRFSPLGWTVSCSRAPPLDPRPATSISHTRAVRAPCRVPSPSGLPTAWVWVAIIRTVRSICLQDHPPFPFTLCLPRAHTTLTTRSTAKDWDLLLLWATNDKHLLTCSKECFSFFSVFLEISFTAFWTV